SRALALLGLLGGRDGTPFFFSSRRRHTMFSRDWSSDVCSSDLFDEHLGMPLEIPVGVARVAGHHQVRVIKDIGARDEQPHLHVRSEERRVGKECRSWWSRFSYKEKIAAASFGGCMAAKTARRRY